MHENSPAQASGLLLSPLNVFWSCLDSKLYQKKHRSYPSSKPLSLIEVTNLTEVALQVQRPTLLEPGPPWGIDVMICRLMYWLNHRQHQQYLFKLLLILKFKCHSLHRLHHPVSTALAAYSIYVTRMSGPSELAAGILASLL